MFAPSTYKPTYSGPITMSGETVRRARNDAVAQGLSQANARALRPMQAGVQAGTGNQRYRTTLLSGLGQQEAMAAGQNAYNQLAQQNASAGMAYQANLATEMAGLRDLLFSKLQSDSQYDLGKRDLDTDRELAEARRRVSSEIGDAQIMGDRVGVMAGLLSSGDRMLDPDRLARARLITPAFYNSKTAYLDDYKNFGRPLNPNTSLYNLLRDR